MGMTESSLCRSLSGPVPADRAALLSLAGLSLRPSPGASPAVLLQARRVIAITRLHWDVRPDRRRRSRSRPESLSA